MSEQAIAALLERRAQITNQVRDLQATIFHLDGALVALGYKPGRAPGRGKTFARGELIALVGEAERAGCGTVREIAAHIMAARGMDASDAALFKTMLGRVKDCRKRTSAVVRAAALAAG